MALASQAFQRPWPPGRAPLLIQHTLGVTHCLRHAPRVPAVSDVAPPTVGAPHDPPHPPRAGTAPPPCSACMSLNLSSTVFRSAPRIVKICPGSIPRISHVRIRSGAYIWLQTVLLQLDEHFLLGLVIVSSDITNIGIGHARRPVGRALKVKKMLAFAARK